MQIVAHPDGIIFSVRVTPRASLDAIEGEFQGALKIRLTAPPVDDRANDALRKFLAASLGIAASSIKIISGEKSRTKRILIKGLTQAQLQHCLGPKGA
jgi:uncharacterized protein